MAVLNDPNTAANVMAVGAKAFSPAHMLAGPFPVGNGGAYRVSMQSATLSASLAADSEIYQFRYVTSNNRVALVYGVSISACLNVAATAAAVAAFRMTVARSWTVAGSAGTRATLTGNNGKLRTSHQTSEVNDIGISSTTNLSTGTKTLDAQDLGCVDFGVLTGAITVQVPGILCPRTNLLGEFAGGLGFPLVLANQEGFVIRTGVAMPAGMTWRFGVDTLWTETDAF